MNLTDHFTLAEFEQSSTATRLGIDNHASLEIVAQLTKTAVNMEKVRALLGGLPIAVDSAYRCPMLNTAVRGAKDSAHCTGDAVDFTCPAFGTPLQIARRLAASGLKFDQLLQEGTWVHVSFAPALRQQVMTAHFTEGRATYTQGLAAP